MSSTQSNSLHQQQVSGASLAQRIAILSLLEEYPQGLTRAEIADQLKMRLSSVCGRIGELKEQQRVVSSHDVRVDQATGRKVRPIIAL
jgi:DNA-binding transcriptional ArsR family regulator